MRIDKWIWAVRMVKTRTLAGALCKKGKVLLNGNPAKPSSNIKRDDMVEVRIKQVIKIYKVIGLIPKRVSASLAEKNYEDFSPKSSHIDKNSPEYFAPNATREKGSGRPTKKDYRQIQAFWFDY